MQDNVIQKKKIIYPINKRLNQYLRQYDRFTDIPINYTDLKHYISSTPLYDKSGRDTLWETVLFSPTDMRELYPALARVYAMLKTHGDMSVMEHLAVDRVDYCTFGNTNPFRIRIINKYNDNYDYYYVKIADASRVYGLELEHILSPNRINYYVRETTLIEEHIAGIPGDVFIDTYLEAPNANHTRIAKEFVKFNERCFIRLLGDMRAYNFVVDITPDFDDVQYRIKAIDFDQQSYEGKKTMYQPHYFKENRKLVDLGIKLMNDFTLKQYQQEERTLLSIRANSARYRLNDLIECMSNDVISKPENVQQLKDELINHYNSDVFLHCNNMGELLAESLKFFKLKSK